MTGADLKKWIEESGAENCKVLYRDENGDTMELDCFDVRYSEGAKIVLLS